MLFRFLKASCWLLACSLVVAKPLSAAPPLGLYSVEILRSVEGLVDLEVWNHPDGDRLVALTSTEIYALYPEGNTRSLWLPVGGIDLESSSDRVFVCGSTGLTVIQGTKVEQVWTGDCQQVELGDSLWLQTGSELLSLDLENFQEQQRVSLEEEFNWALWGERLVQWRADPAKLSVQSSAGQLSLEPTGGVRSLIIGETDLRWLEGDGDAIIDLSLGRTPLSFSVDQIIPLKDHAGWYAGLHMDSRAISLFEQGGGQEVLLPTMIAPEHLLIADLDRDSCADFVVWGEKLSWIRTHCVQQKPVEEPNGLQLSKTWLIHDLVLGASVELPLLVEGEPTITLHGLPKGLGYLDGVIRGIPDAFGTFPVTAMLGWGDGRVEALGFSLRVTGIDGTIPESTITVSQEPSKSSTRVCLAMVGAMMGSGSANTDWFNLTGRPTYFGSPMASLLCTTTKEKRIRLMYGADSEPTALVTEGQLKLAMGTAVLHYGGPYSGVGLYGSLGLISVSGGIRLAWAPSQLASGRHHGVELRVGWLPATLSAIEISAGYTWELGRKYQKDPPS